jgi:hypothetical protein
MADLSFVLRALLITGSLSTVIFMLQRIRAAKVQIKDSIFWLVFAFLLLLISIFPGIAGFFSKLLRFQAPINFVYLLILFVLLIQQFSSTVRISRLDAQLQQLTQRQALDEKDRQDERERQAEPPTQAKADRRNR